MRFFKTIKFRMNLWYLMLLAIVILFFSITTYLMLDQRISIMNLDAVKFSVLKAQITPIATTGNPPDTRQSDSAYKLLFSYVINSDQLQQIQSAPSSPFEAMSPEGIFSFDQKAIISPEMAGEQQVWIYSRPLANETGYYDLLVVIQSKAPSLSLLGAYKQVLYIAIPVTLFLAGLLGYFLIRRLLYPLGVITKATKEIREKDLERRIEIKSNDELGELSATLNQTFDRLQKSFDREHQFTSDTSHELRAPLAIMQGEATLALNRSRSEEEYRQHLESISEQVSHMSSVVNKLLFLARSDKSKESLNLEDVNLKNILEEIIEVTRTFREEKKLILHSNLTEDNVIRGDEVKFRELFLNLIDNAIKYTPPGGVINISLAKQNNLAEIIVQDTGIGISEENLPHIFERFYRVNKAGSDGGNGLGLAICKRIIELHHGKIEVESKVGEGSIFTVTIPL